MDHLPWPSGDYQSVAVIGVSRSVLELWFGMPLIQGVEPGLGEWNGCGGILRNGEQIELIKHVRSPGPSGYELRCDSKANASKVLQSTLAELGLTYTAVVWQSSKHV